MALIKCPECKKKISDQCENCPHCGYPIKANISSDTTDSTNNPTSTNKKPLFKCAWFWAVIAAIIIAAAITVTLLLNREVEPKLDANGNPVFVELTDVVYTNADEYLGYYVNVKGKVFQNLGDNGETKGVQIWIDSDNCEQNMMIHYTTNETLKDGDYVICTGYIKEIHEYTNTYGTELSVPLIYSTDLRSASYIEVMAPTVSTITPENLIYEKYGYSITIDKVEYAESETRLYLTASNIGNATLHIDVDSSVIVQDGKQFHSETNFEENYEEVPYNLNKGTTASGVVVFPAIGDGKFDYIIELHSDNDKEKFKTITFAISEESSSVYVPVVKPTTVWDFDNLKYETKGYAIQIIKIEFYEDETLVYVTAMNDGKAALHVDTDGAVIVQNKRQYNAECVYDTDYDELPYSIARGASATGVIVYPAIETAEFEYTIVMHSDDYNEDFKDIVFSINAEAPICKNEENEVWRLTAIINTNMYDSENGEASISKYDPVYLHLIPRGGKPSTKIRIKEVIKTPDGQTISRVYDDSFFANQKVLYGWTNGLYVNPETGTCGTLKIEFYNADTGEKIGEVSVQITD